jgi:sugar/nucleoside kinase (ribokinase family)
MNDVKKYDVVVAGYTCVDLFPEFKKTGAVDRISDLLQPGKLIEIDGLNCNLGGAVPNTGLALKKFGRKVFLNGLVGEDIIGRLAMELFDKRGVSEGIKTTAKAGTAFSIVLAPPGIDRIFLESPGCNQVLDNSFINFDAVGQSRLFHFGYPPLLRQFYINDGSETADLFSRVQGMGAITSLDFSLPDMNSDSGKVSWPQFLENVLPHTDIFVPSIEEAFQVIRPDKYNELLEKGIQYDDPGHPVTKNIREIGRSFIRSGVKILLIKAGDKGSYLLTGDVSALNQKYDINLNEDEWNFREFWCSAYHADASRINNTSGAGDTAIAAFLSAILDGESPEIAARYACLAGRNVLYCHDSYEDPSNWNMMTDEIKSEPHEIVAYQNKPF